MEDQPFAAGSAEALYTSSASSCQSEIESAFSRLKIIHTPLRSRPDDVEATTFADYSRFVVTSDVALIETNQKHFIEKKERNEVSTVDNIDDLTELERMRLLEMSTWALKMTEEHEAAQLERGIEKSGIKLESDVLLEEARAYFEVEQHDSIADVDTLLESDPLALIGGSSATSSSSSAPAPSNPVDAQVDDAVPSGVPQKEDAACCDLGKREAPTDEHSERRVRIRSSNEYESA